MLLRAVKAAISKLQSSCSFHPLSQQRSFPPFGDNQVRSRGEFLSWPQGEPYGVREPCMLDAAPPGRSRKTLIAVLFIGILDLDGKSCFIVSYHWVWPCFCTHTYDCCSLNIGNIGQLR